jgi:Inositol-pentakisphosphate 2-kinase
VPIDEKVIDEFYDRLLDMTKLMATNAQRSKYDIDGLVVDRSKYGLLEEDLMTPVFREVDIKHGDLVLHVEIKMKSSLTVMPSKDMIDFVNTFMTNSPEANKKDVAKILEKHKDKMKGSEENQFFMRNVIAAANPENTSKLDKARGKSHFDGVSFFLRGQSGRAEAISDISSHESNYFRVFDLTGKSLNFKEYSTLLASYFEDWHTTFSKIIAQSISDELTNTIAFMQHILGGSIGDTMLRLVKLNYASVKKQKGVGYLLSNSDFIIKAVLECMENRKQLNEREVPYISNYDIIRNKVTSRLSKDCISDIDLQILYTCALTIMTFCDASVIIKLVVSNSHEINMMASLNDRLTCSQILTPKNKYLFAAKIAVIDVGAKKDKNLAKLIDQFYELDKYASYLNSK